MKKRAAMGGVQMFSFLDAMICTLGALLVLLHAFARHGQSELQRKAEAQAKATQESGEDPRVALELLQWRVEELRTARAKTEAQLTDQRLRLAHIEDHHRRLETKLDELKTAAAQIQRSANSGQNDRLRDLAALEAARVRLTEARDAADRAQQRSKHAASYSVVPYEGPNSTRRRPIYIECRAHSMILQPEGVELVPEDFAGFLGPGNPLATALRGTSEYYARQAPPGQPRGDPYPLLLVRPEGVSTYYAALGALDSWGAEFGYELIGSDWELKFTEPDERLAQLLRQIVADARQRMRELMLATADLRSRRPHATLRASNNGGFVSESGPGSSQYGRTQFARGRGWDSLDSEWLRGQSGSSDASDEAPDANAGSIGDSAAGESGQPSTGGKGYGGGNEQPAGGDGRAARDRRGPGPYDNRLAGQSSSGGGAIADGPSPGDGDRGSGATAAAPSSDPNAPGSATSGGKDPPSQLAGAAGHGQDNPSSAGAADASSATGEHSAPGSGAPGASGTESCEPGDSGFSATIQVPHKRETAASIARRRGRGWALPDSAGDQTGVTRPILVECHRDRLVIVPDTRGQESHVTYLDLDAQDTMDEFVTGVWQHTRSWGIAGRGLYWRPTLVMAVDPDAADRYAEIKTLLTESGLDVRARRPAAAATSADTQRPPTR